MDPNLFRLRSQPLLTRSVSPTGSNFGRWSSAGTVPTLERFWEESWHSTARTRGPYRARRRRLRAARSGQQSRAPRRLPARDVRDDEDTAGRLRHGLRARRAGCTGVKPLSIAEALALTAFVLVVTAAITASVATGAKYPRAHRNIMRAAAVLGVSAAVLFIAAVWTHAFT